MRINVIHKNSISCPCGLCENCLIGLKSELDFWLWRPAVAVGRRWKQLLQAILADGLYGGQVATS